MGRRQIGWLVAALSATAPASLAQQAARPAAATTAVIPYPAAFFTPFKPASAQDMVSRVPGFTVVEGDASIRGFSGAAGNVLIDGERPTSKAVKVSDLLNRIAPEAVERIELIRGGAPGIDMQGQAVVVNVVRRKGAQVSREVQLWTKFYGDHQPARIAYLIGSRTTANTSMEGTVQYRREALPDSGDGSVVRRNALGSVTAAGPFRSRAENRISQASGAIEGRRGRDTLRLNLGLDRTDIPRAETSTLLTAAGATVREETTAAQVNDRAEAGLDALRRLDGGGRLKLQALYTYKHNDLATTLSTPTTRQASRKRATAGEGVARGAFGGPLSARLALEGGAEGAYNYLDSRSTLTVGGAPVVVPSANIHVQELRAEGYVTANAQVTNDLSVEARLRVETSRISQSGDASRSRRFSFIKPRVVASWSGLPRTQIRLRVERQVGQLNFEDFAASGDLLSGSINAGNANLQPESAWLGEVAVERTFWGSGALVVTASRAQVSDAIDYVPARGFDALGNVGDGVRKELRADLSVPLDRVRLREARLIANGTWRLSHVQDPITGEARRVSRERPFEGMITFTQNLPRLNSSYTLQVNTFGYEERTFRLAEVRTDQETYQLKFYWDVRPRPGLNIRLQAENFVGKERRRFRTLYSGTRASGLITLDEARNARFDPFIMIRVRQTF